MLPFELIIDFIIISVYTYYNVFYTTKHNTQRLFSLQQLIPSIIFFCVLTPLVEESVFRLALPILTLDYFPNYFTFKLFSCILFGISHLKNIDFYKNWELVIVQSINAFFLGYVLMGLPTLQEQIIAHGIYNFMTIIYLITLLYFKNKKSIIIPNSHTVYPQYPKHRLSKSNSDSDLKSFRNLTCKPIKFATLPPSIKEIHNKYNQKIDKRLYN